MSFLETGFILPSRGAQPPGDLFSQALTPACIRGAVSSLFKQSPPVSSRACSAWRSLFPGYFTYPSLHQRSSQQLIQTVSACVIARSAATWRSLFPGYFTSPSCIRGAVSSGFKQSPPVSSRACSAWRSQCICSH